jgi:hypothetical protein
MRRERVREASAGMARLGGLLERDWREETLSVEEIVKRAEGCFIQQTQVAVEIERLERLLATHTELPAGWQEIAGLFEDLRLGIERWQREVSDVLERSAPGDAAEARCDGKRLVEWNAWVAESLGLIEQSIARGGMGDSGAQTRLATGLEKVSGEVAQSSQEISALSREVAQLQQAWTRLGERLRTLMVRAGEMHEDSPGAPVATEGEAESV